MLEVTFAWILGASFRGESTRLRLLNTDGEWIGLTRRFGGETFCNGCFISACC